MKKIIYLIPVFFLLSIVIFNCSIDGSGDERDNENNESIKEFKAYSLQSTTHIRLDWELINNSHYNIYRYRLQSDSNPDLVVKNHNTNEYYDDSANPDTPYFYKVTSVIDGAEGDMSNFVFGLRSNEVDSFEDNRNLSDLQNTNAGLPINQDFDAIIYSCKKDIIGGIETDVDWYKYRGTAEYFEVRITLGNTGFNNDDMKLLFRYERSDYRIYEEEFSISDNSTTICGFDGYDIDTGLNPVNVYFKIYIDENNVDTTKNIIENYKLEISKF